jgi:hypothetical protein
MRAGGEILERYNIPRSTVDFSLMGETMKRSARSPIADRPPAASSGRRHNQCVTISRPSGPLR